MDTELFWAYINSIQIGVDRLAGLNLEDEADYQNALVHLHVIQLDAEYAADMLREFHNAEREEAE